MRLREIRKAKGLTMKDVAKILNVSESAVSQYENGKRELDYASMTKLADYFNVSIDYLLEREENLIIPENIKNVPMAFYDGLDGLTQQDLDAVSDFVKFLKSKYDKKDNI